MLSETFLIKLFIEKIALFNDNSDSLFAICTTLQYPREMNDRQALYSENDSESQTGIEPATF